MKYNRKTSVPLVSSVNVFCKCNSEGLKTPLKFSLIRREIFWKLYSFQTYLFTYISFLLFNQLLTKIYSIQALHRNPPAIPAAAGVLLGLRFFRRYQHMEVVEWSARLARKRAFRVRCLLAPLSMMHILL